MLFIIIQSIIMNNIKQKEHEKARAHRKINLILGNCNNNNKTCKCKKNHKHSKTLTGIELHLLQYPPKIYGYYY